MATVVHNLSYKEFQQRFGERHEYWYGEAIPKGMPTWIHGLLQKLVMSLLDQAGFIAASEVELRIEPEARPKPDVIATRSGPTETYPTKAPDVIVEIISEDDTYFRVREKCRKYEEWGCALIYLVDPSDRSVSQWQDGSMVAVKYLAEISADDLWTLFDEQMKKRQ